MRKQARSTWPVGATPAIGLWEAFCVTRGGQKHLSTGDRRLEAGQIGGVSRARGLEELLGEPDVPGERRAPCDADEAATSGR